MGGRVTDATLAQGLMGQGLTCVRRDTANMADLYSHTHKAVENLVAVTRRISCRRQTRRWTMAAFFHLLDVAVWAARVICRITAGGEGARRFVWLVSEGLVRNQVERRALSTCLPETLWDTVQFVRHRLASTRRPLPIRPATNVTSVHSSELVNNGINNSQGSIEDTEHSELFDNTDDGESESLAMTVSQSSVFDQSETSQTEGNSLSQASNPGWTCSASGVESVLQDPRVSQCGQTSVTTTKRGRGRPRKQHSLTLGASISHNVKTGDGKQKRKYKMSQSAASKNKSVEWAKQAKASRLRTSQRMKRKRTVSLERQSFYAYDTDDSLFGDCEGSSFLDSGSIKKETDASVFENKDSHLRQFSLHQNLAVSSTTKSRRARRGRCYLCTWRKDYKTRRWCRKCSAWICARHTVIRCPACYLTNKPTHTFVIDHTTLAQNATENTGARGEQSEWASVSVWSKREASKIVSKLASEDAVSASPADSLCLEDSVSGDTSFEGTPTSRRKHNWQRKGRCTSCGWRKDVKSTNSCGRCKDWVCKRHAVLLCPNCVEN